MDTVVNCWNCLYGQLSDYHGDMLSRSMIKGNVCVGECVKEERKDGCGGSFREGRKPAERRCTLTVWQILLGCVSVIRFPFCIYRVPIDMQHLEMQGNFEMIFFQPQKVMKIFTVENNFFKLCSAIKLHQTSLFVSAVSTNRDLRACNLHDFSSDPWFQKNILYGLHSRRAILTHSNFQIN